MHRQIDGGGIANTISTNLSFRSSCTLPPVAVIWTKENGLLILGVGLLTEHNNRVIMPTRWLMLAI